VTDDGKIATDFILLDCYFWECIVISIVNQIWPLKTVLSAMQPILPNIGIPYSTILLFVIWVVRESATEENFGGNVPNTIIFRMGQCNAHWPTGDLFC